MLFWKKRKITLLPCQRDERENYFCFSPYLMGFSSPLQKGGNTNYKMYCPTQLEYGSLQVGCSDSKFLLPWKVPIFSLSKQKTLSQIWIRKTYLYDFLCATHFLSEYIKRCVWIGYTSKCFHCLLEIFYWLIWNMI